MNNSKTSKTGDGVTVREIDVIQLFGAIENARSRANRTGFPEVIHINDYTRRIWSDDDTTTAAAGDAARELKND